MLTCKQQTTLDFLWWGSK